MDVKFTYEPDNRRLTAWIVGDIDHHTAKQIRTEIDRAVKEHNPTVLVISFKEVSFMDSSGIGLVMGRYKLMSDMGGEVFTADPPPYIRRVMQLAGLHRLCKIISLEGKAYSENKSDRQMEENKNEE